MTYLLDQLSAYGNSDYYGFHMPGHKRNQLLMGAELPYSLDITEIEHFDDLHHPDAEGVLLKAQERAAAVYGAEETHFLVNGSTSGNLSGILGCTTRGGKILIARNSHRSVYNGVYMQGLTPVYLYPKFDQNSHLNMEVSVSDVERELKIDSEIQAVMIVSPTYDGVVSDVAAIAAVAHRYGVPLIVDEAHGAHFGFHPDLPENSNRLGADIVIHSLHKTMPSLTQTALLHINGKLVDRNKVRKYLSILQSSSPSYVLMASMDQCIRRMEEDGKKLFNDYIKNLSSVRDELKQLTSLEMLETKHFDPSKIIISTKNTNITSKELYRRLLEEYHLQMEMVAGTYIVAMTSIADTTEGFQRLVQALKEIDRKVQRISEQSMVQSTDPLVLLGTEYPKLEMRYTSSQMDEFEVEEPSIATRYSYLYPPGIPLVVPGEVVTEEVERIIETYVEAGFVIEHN